MEDHGAKVFRCSSWQDMVAAANALNATLPIELRREFNRVFGNCTLRYGWEGAYERLNNQTLAAIFAEYQSDDVKPIEGGEAGGLRWDLYDAPPDEGTGAK